MKWHQRYIYNTNFSTFFKISILKTLTLTKKKATGIKNYELRIKPLIINSQMSLLLGTELFVWQGSRLREDSFTEDAAVWAAKLVWSKPNPIYFGGKVFEDTFKIETFDKNCNFSVLRKDLWGDPIISVK